MAIITKIESQKNRYERVNIYVDGEFFCAMQHIVCVKHGLKENATVDKDFLTSLTFESDKEKALNKVAGFLSKGVKTQKQVKDYLVKYGYDTNIIAYVLEKLKEYNYINDEQYAVSYVNTYGKKFGKRKIEYDLKLKGVSQKEIDHVLQTFESDEEVMLNIAKKYMKNKEHTLQNMQKLSQHLSYKGFGWDEINRTISHFKKEIK